MKSNTQRAKQLYIDSNWPITRIASELELTVPEVCRLLLAVVPSKAAARQVRRALKQTIRRARDDGDSFSSIAESLEVSLETVLAAAARSEIASVREEWNNEHVEYVDDDDEADDREEDPAEAELGPKSYTPPKSQGEFAQQVTEPVVRQMLNYWGTGIFNRLRLGSRIKVHSISASWFWRIHTGMELSKYICEREGFFLNHSWASWQQPNVLGHFNGCKFDECYEDREYSTVEGAVAVTETHLEITPTVTHTESATGGYPDDHGVIIGRGQPQSHTTGGEYRTTKTTRMVGGKLVDHTKSVLTSQSEYRCVSHLETKYLGHVPLPEALAGTAAANVQHFNRDRIGQTDAELTTGWPADPARVVADSLVRLTAKLEQRPKGMDICRTACALHQVPFWTVQYSVGSGPRQTLWIYGTDRKVYAPAEPVGIQTYALLVIAVAAAFAVGIFLK